MESRAEAKLFALEQPTDLIQLTQLLEDSEDSIEKSILEFLMKWAEWKSSEFIQRT
jgi:hypothetical protein